MEEADKLSETTRDIIAAVRDIIAPWIELLHG